jgi:enterochelin esterase family protein
MHIWTPAGYNLGKEKLPVLYLIHGIGDSDMAWPNVGRAGLIMDNLLAEGKAKRMLIVMPDGRTEGNSITLFSEDMKKDLMPFIEANYNVFTDAAHRAIAGLSWGGMETMETFLDSPDMFSFVNVMSSGWFFDDEQLISDKEKKLEKAAPILLRTENKRTSTQVRD